MVTLALQIYMKTSLEIILVYQIKDYVQRLMVAGPEVCSLDMRNITMNFVDCKGTSRWPDDVLSTLLHVCVKFLIDSLLIFFPHFQLVWKFHFDGTTTFTSIMV